MSEASALKNFSNEGMRSPCSTQPRDHGGSEGFPESGHVPMMKVEVATMVGFRIVVAR